MPNADRTVLVSGATGRQGGAVVRHMLPKGWKLRALTRNPSSYSSQELARQGVEVVQGDLEDPPSLERASRGVYGIYSVQDFWTVGAKREVQQGKNLADVAKKAGVAHFVYSSVGGAERNSGIDHWESKWRIEGHVRKLGLPATMLRPAEFIGRELEIAGSELTNPEAARVFSKVLGREVRFQPLPMLAVRLFLGKEFY